MGKLNENKVNILIWGTSAVICCLLIYFVCLPFYQYLSFSGGSFLGLKVFFLIIYTISLFFIVLLISYVTALFIIDCLRINQKTLMSNKITGMLTTMIVFIVSFSPMISLKKLPILNELFQLFIFWVIITMTIILLSRFVLQKIGKHPILLGIASMIAFNIFMVIYSFKTDWGRGAGGGLDIFILLLSIAVGLISTVVNLIEKKKLKSFAGRSSK